MRKFATLGAALAMLASWATTAGAATLTIYTDKTEWENASGGQFLTEPFSDDQLNSGVSFVSSESAARYGRGGASSGLGAWRRGVP